MEKQQSPFIAKGPGNTISVGTTKFLADYLGVPSMRKGTKHTRNNYKSLYLTFLLSQLTLSLVLEYKFLGGKITSFLQSLAHLN